MMLDFIRYDWELLAVIAAFFVLLALVMWLGHMYGHETGYRKGCEDGNRDGFRDAQQRYDEGYIDGQTNYAQEHAPHRDAKGRFTR